MFFEIISYFVFCFFFSCKEYQNLNAFFAVVMGLSNMAVSRLQQTWEKIPSKFRKLYQEFEALIDPSRNHRAYRVFVGKLQPPLIPFMPLLLKDMTFAHEGNKTSLDGLVNFEKMHMMAQTMRTLRFCRSRSLGKFHRKLLKKSEMRIFIYVFFRPRATFTQKRRRGTFIYKLSESYRQSKGVNRHVSKNRTKS